MEGNQVHRVEEVLFSFSYAERKQASRCNAKLGQLMANSILPELENSFDQVSQGGVILELDRLEIDLGSLSEEDISDDLGEKIRRALVLALKKEIRERIIGGFGNPGSNPAHSPDFTIAALRTFLLKGYFPAWIDSYLKLTVLLEFLIAKYPKAIGDLVIEVSLKSEAARKRIAFLEAPYFDQIIRILVPQDAKWIIGYRDTYQEIHQTESLPGQSENLKKSLNLFILTFITRNSGTKFNRLSFSDRFLKSIASHYNLDFKEFLQEITQILSQNTIENQLFRDFKEAITWVGKKNQLSSPKPQKHYQPTYQELISWLEQPNDNEPIQSWVQNMGLSGGIFQKLSTLFPEFWKKLSKPGLTSLIKLLGQRQADQWMELTYAYLAWNSRQSKPESLDHLKAVKEIFDLAGKDSLRNNFLLLDLEGWFSLLVSHAFSRFGAKTAISNSLVDLGSKAGISNSSLLLIKVKNRGKEKEMQESGSDPVNSSSPVDHVQPGKSISGGFHELVLFEYLNSGTLGTSFRSMGKNDLQWLVAGMVKAFNSNLYHLIRNSTSPNDADLKKRILGLLAKLNRGQVVDYITRFGGSQSLNLLRFNENLIGVLNPGATLIQHLDQVVWSIFIREAKAEKNIGREGKSDFSFASLDSYFSALRRINITVPSGKMLIDALQKKRNAEKLLLLFFAQNQGLSQLALSRLGNIISAKAHFNPGYGLLDLKRVKAQEILQSQRFNKLFRKIHSSTSGEHLFLLSKVGGDSLLPLLFSRKISQKELDHETLLILKRDFALLIKNSFLESYMRIKNQELSAVSQRIFLFFQSNPEGLERFLHRHKRRIPLILYSLHQYMKGGDWKKLYPWLNRSFPDELGIFNQMSDPKFGSAWDNLSAWVGKSGQGNHMSLDWNQILHLSKGLGLENSQLSGELARALHPDLADEVRFLLEIPEGAFHRKSVSVIWRKSVLLSAFQFNRGKESGKWDSQKSFWRTMVAFIKDRRSAFGPESMDWNYLLNSGRLKSESKALLLRFFKSNYLKSNSRVQDSSRQERIASAMVHLKEEGFLPWWSPVKSKSELMFSLITIIDHSKKEEGLLLVSLLSQPKASALLAGINQEKLLQLLKRLSSSPYKRHFDSLIREINSRLEGSNLPKGTTDPESERKTFSSENIAADFKDKPQGELEHWIKKKLNASRETEIISDWFENDPRIKNQMEELLGWGRYMFFGNLNPGKWKFWLLGFGYDFYLRKGNSYSASFLNQFLVHLSKSQGLVNWKAVFHHLLKHKEFFTGLNVASREQILSRFPRDQERKSGELNSGDQVRITNAGLILCWPFLSVLFSRLKLSSGGVIPVESQPRAVFLLQYLAYGHCEFPEYELVLNKVLVGMKSSQHLEKTELSTEEMEMAESLLKGMKSNWEKMKNATVDAIRETFLQREGILEFGSASNVLRIQKTGVDVLLDSVSWNIAVVRLPWMEKSLEVKWR